MRSLHVLRGFLFLFLVGFEMPFLAAAQEAPVVPLLESHDAQVRQQPAEAEPARALPAEMTICADRAAKRCWTEPGESTCKTDNGSGAVFGAVRVAEDASGSGAMLQKCWAEMDGDE